MMLLTITDQEGEGALVGSTIELELDQMAPWPDLLAAIARQLPIMGYVLDADTLANDLAGLSYRDYRLEIKL